MYPYSCWYTRIWNPIALEYMFHEYFNYYFNIVIKNKQTTRSFLIFFNLAQTYWNRYYVCIVGFSKLLNSIYSHWPWLKWTYIAFVVRYIKLFNTLNNQRLIQNVLKSSSITVLTISFKQLRTFQPFVSIKLLYMTIQLHLYRYLYCILDRSSNHRSHTLHSQLVV